MHKYQDYYSKISFPVKTLIRPLILAKYIPFGKPVRSISIEFWKSVGDMINTFMPKALYISTLTGISASSMNFPPDGLGKIFTGFDLLTG